MKGRLLLLIASSLLWSCTQKSQEESEDHGHSHADGTEHTHSDESGTHDQEEFVEVKDAYTVQRSEISPEYVQMASGVEIIENISDWETKTGVETHEGYFGPLLFGSEIRAFFIVLHPGQFLSEHPHPTESMVYTVSGKWVLCSEGKRQVMTPGTLFHFGDNKPTGWEAPFGEDAHLLVVKGRTPDENWETYRAGLQSMANMVDEQHQGGTEFWFHEISADHPARQFGSQVNPDFDQLIADLESGKRGYKAP